MSDKPSRSRISFVSIGQSAPAHLWFGVSSIFHYLGPSFAVLLFPAVGVLGVAWLRIASAALVFAPWTKPWRTLRLADRPTRMLLVGLGVCLATMNVSFYFALDRLPMSLVAAIEFVGAIGIALYGLRTARNVLAVVVAVLGVFLLIDVRWSSNLPGLGWALLNGVLFTGYVVLGHRISESGARGGVERLGAAMAIAFVCIFPIGLVQVVQIFGTVHLVLAGVGVGICSSVIPYVCDQMAMSRLPRATFALLLALLPAMATVIAVIVLAQIPSAQDLMGVMFVMMGVAMHRSPRPRDSTRDEEVSPGQSWREPIHSAKPR